MRSNSATPVLTIGFHFFAYAYVESIQRSAKPVLNRRVAMDACGLCGGPAEYAVHALISTRRARPRRQKCSRAAVFCGACIRASAPGCETPIPTVLLQCFWDAYTS